MNISTVFAVLGVACDTASSLILVLPVARESAKSRQTRASTLAQAEYPMKSDPIVTAKIVRVLNHQTPYEMRKQVEEQWIDRFKKDRRRAHWAAGLALFGAVLTMLSTLV